MTKKTQKVILTTLLVVIVTTGLLGPGILYLGGGGDSGGEERNIPPEETAEKVPCLNPSQPVAEEYRIHTTLRIVVGGAEIPIPPDIGADIYCERVIHTHDGSGTIHIEPNGPWTFTLGDFFWTWDKPFSRRQMLDYRADAGHEIVMTVNGEPNTEFEKLVLQNKQAIVIEYRPIGSADGQNP